VSRCAPLLAWQGKKTDKGVSEQWKGGRRTTQSKRGGKKNNKEDSVDGELEGR